MRVRFALLVVSLIVVPGPGWAQAPSMEDQLAEALVMLRAQQAQLEDQAKQLELHSGRIDRLQAQVDDLIAPAELDMPGQEEAPEAPPLIAAPAPPEPEGPAPSVPEEAEPETPREVAQGRREATQDDPTRAILESLPGAMRLPGTNAVLRWGGYVKTSIVQNFDPLAINDRFIVGSIPATDVQGIEEETEITVSQSRVNLDLREPTSVGLVRAFVEGDFDADGDTFRLRHAFGQRGSVLAGKTWSGFVDTTASPEEIDFEGLNGRINVRQAQVRFQPGIGRKYEMVMSLEDPNPRVTNGNGVSQMPDFVTSGRVNFGDDIHLRLALLLRQVRAQWEVDNNVEKEFGWGASVSGRIDTRWPDARDNVLFQLNVGQGFGRYVNDLSSVGDFDGIFSPDGDLELIDVVSGYISAQHWWRRTMRSNFTLGYVEIDAPGFVEDDFYKRTFRASANLLWSPTPRIDVGAELLWGRRENEDGSDGDATQAQLAVKYLF